MSRRFPIPDRRVRPSLPTVILDLPHEWRRESAVTRFYRCTVCGARCSDPEEVIVTCAELLAQGDTGRRRNRNNGYRRWEAP